jgi:3-hydroxyethyl bacteriochlorophyllide a dehydrogenase
MNTTAVLIEQPERLRLADLRLTEPTDDDVVVEVDWSGISTGTERLLFDGRMPAFPGMGYPLVPGYESVGRVVATGHASGHAVGQQVFVPGANCYQPFGDQPVRGLFGGAASRLVVPGRRAIALDAGLGQQAVLLALAATAYHAVACGGKVEHPRPPQLIVGHGVLGRLLARLNVAAGCTDTVVWETQPVRAEGAAGYTVLDPKDDPRRDYQVICDVSGDASLLDTLIARLAPQGEIVLAGFYSQPLQFNFAPAFMREARIRAAAEWQRPDLLAVQALVAEGRLSLDGLITHQEPFGRADAAYRTAFGEAACLKMVLDWTH